jgi:A/G-specific adenine glycosylase
MSNLSAPWSSAQAHAVVTALLPWQRTHGRHDLPWQRTQDPYRVWLSEIMLQQTQVATVKAYYARFLSACPDVQALAQASTDEVMALWAGLGYYSRARHLHQCAQQVVNDWGGSFPPDAKGLQTLAGVGPSTAAAIASICYGERVAILDGNVKRVLARCLAWEQDVGDAASTKALQLAANALALAVPAPTDMPTLTQGLMDLGATVCKPRQADCTVCPLASLCAAHGSHTVQRYPIKRSRITRKSERWWLLLAQDLQGRWCSQTRLR